MATNVALQSPLDSRLGAYAWLLTVSTRKSGRASRVQVHWLCVALPSDWATRDTLPGRYWPSVAALTAWQAFGTERNSPGRNVVTSPLPADGDDWPCHGRLPVSHSTSTTATTTSPPPPATSLRRDFLARAAAARRPRFRSGTSSRGHSSSASGGPAPSWAGLARRAPPSTASGPLAAGRGAAARPPPAGDVPRPAPRGPRPPRG